MTHRETKEKHVTLIFTSCYVVSQCLFDWHIEEDCCDVQEFSSELLIQCQILNHWLFCNWNTRGNCGEINEHTVVLNCGLNAPENILKGVMENTPLVPFLLAAVVMRLLCGSFSLFLSGCLIDRWRRATITHLYLSICLLLRVWFRINDNYVPEIQTKGLNHTSETHKIQLNSALAVRALAACRESVGRMLWKHWL